MPGRTRVLSMRDVKQSITMAECVDLQRRVFAAHAQGKAWNGSSAWVERNARESAYPAAGKMMTGGIEPDWWGMKMLGARLGESDTRGRVQILALYDAKTLLPAALMEANYLGMLRTGAAAAVATEALARPDAGRIGVLGTGATARFSLLALAAAGWPIAAVQVYSPSPQRRQAFARDMAAVVNAPVTAGSEAEGVVRQAEILITGTASAGPVLADGWVQPGTHINAMGQRYEIDPVLFTRSRNICDDIGMATAAGKLSTGVRAEIITAADAHASLGEVITQARPGRGHESEITLFDSSGLCMQDVIVGVHILSRLQSDPAEQSVEIWHDDPLW